MKNLSKIFLLLICFINFSFAQGEGALPFTILQQSPLLLGAGQIGAAIPNDASIGFYYNPAILGYSSRNNHASISVMPSQTGWFSISERKPTFNNYGFNAGYNLKKSQFNLPITIGVGYIHNKFDYGSLPGDNDETYEKFNCFSIGVGVNYYFNLNFGFSLKSFSSQPFTGRFGAEIPTLHADGIIWDYGTLLTFPISSLFMNHVKFSIDNNAQLKPIVNFTFGYSITNVGDEIYYIDKTQADPFSRTARLGYTFEIGTDIFLGDTKLNLFKYSFSAEANDILVERVSGKSQYQSGLGDINISDHLINLKSDAKVTVHKGHIFKIFDSVIFTIGRFNGGGYFVTRETNGIGFTSKGVFNLLKSKIGTPAIKYFLTHFTINYFKSDVEFFKRYPTKFDALSVNFKGFEI